jgi:hypothetical protein
MFLLKEIKKATVSLRPPLIYIKKNENKNFNFPNIPPKPVHHKCGVFGQKAASCAISQPSLLLVP